jgi:hypothetical protein
MRASGALFRTLGSLYLFTSVVHATEQCGLRRAKRFVRRSAETSLQTRMFSSALPPASSSTSRQRSLHGLIFVHLQAARSGVGGGQALLNSMARFADGKSSRRRCVGETGGRSERWPRTCPHRFRRGSRASERNARRDRPVCPRGDHRVLRSRRTLAYASAGRDVPQAVEGVDRPVSPRETCRSCGRTRTSVRSSATALNSIEPRSRSGVSARRGAKSLPNRQKPTEATNQPRPKTRRHDARPRSSDADFLAELGRERTSCPTFIKTRRHWWQQTPVRARFAGTGRFRPKQLRMTPPKPEPRAGSGFILSSVGGLVTAGVALVGALWFGLLSLGAAIAYEPAGVRPREIGLGSGTVLTQAGVGFVIGFVIWALGFLAMMLAPWAYSRWRGGERPKWLSRGLLGLALVPGVVIPVFGVQSDARRARDALREGERVGNPRLHIGIRNPWGGEIAEIAWAEKPPAGAPALPSCALYLGEAGGTAVFYSAADKRTWRLPSSTLVVKARPDRQSC